MARVHYSETYRETNLFTGWQREFKREVDISGTASEIKELLAIVFRELPRYNYPVLNAREDSLEKILAQLNS